jgi:uncharacterized surface protein with fasciclin (FAS1) repeats
MRSRTFPVLAISVVAALGLSACGSSSPKAAGDSVAGVGSEVVSSVSEAPLSEVPTSATGDAPVSEAVTTVASGPETTVAPEGDATTLPAEGGATTVASGGSETTLAGGEAPAGDLKDIVDTAVGAGSFNTLAALLTSAGLVDTLKSAGPFTVFAPTDEAFAKIPKADLEALGKDPEKLKKVLTYHVVSGKVLAAAVKPGDVPTVEGGKLTVTVKDGKVMVNDATVTKTDIMCSNGVIHVIDTVLMPK